ncbi:expressed unknown protein [Seminavis robusta]|uniref:Uncharacterized protein n=1 Tax=Seminavis robusta TaxID=568900 RepID=A0A9N8EAD1_9STRA|nr:expressed unknown protein [Seminavis robusta]|eukprot:Sro858_g211800.1 n/a (981) ;mRNA; f:11750-14692
MAQQSERVDGGEASFLNMVLEVDQEASLNDSFSTLGIHSIFSDAKVNKASKAKQQQRSNKKASSGFNALDKFFEEDTQASETVKDTVDLRTLLQKGIKAENQSKHAGNRWLESAGKSVSCRNLKYDSNACIEPPRRCPAPLEVKDLSKACREAVSQAMQLTHRRSATMDASADSNVTEDSDIMDSSVPNTPSSRRDRMQTASRLSQSCRHLGTTRVSDLAQSYHNPPLSPNGATSKARNSLVKKNSAKNLLSASCRSKMTLGPDSPKRRLMKSKSVRHMSTRKSSEVEDNDEDSIALSPFIRGSRPMLRSKSVKYTSTRLDQQQDDDEEESMALSSLLRGASNHTSSKGQHSVSHRKSLSALGSMPDMDTSATSGKSRWTATSATFSAQHQSSMSLLKPQRMVSGHRRSTSFDSSCISDLLSTPVAQKPKQNSATANKKKKASLSSWLEKTQDSEELYDSKQFRENLHITPCSLRSTMARAGRSKSFKIVAGKDGRRSMLQVGKSLSARQLLAREDLDSVPELTPMSADSVVLSTREEKTPAPAMDDSLPGLSPITCTSRTMTTEKVTSTSAAMELAIASPPLTRKEEKRNDVARATERDVKKKDVPMFSTEHILQEIGAGLDFSQRKASPEPKKTVRRDSLSLSRRAQSCRRLSSTKEASVRNLNAASQHENSKSSRRSRDVPDRKSSHDKSQASQEGELRDSRRDNRRLSASNRQKSSRNGMKKEGSSRKMVSTPARSKTYSTPQSSKKDREGDMSASQRGPRRQSSKKHLLNRSLSSSVSTSLHGSVHGSLRDKSITSSAGSSKQELSRSSRGDSQQPARRQRSSRKLLGTNDEGSKKECSTRKRASSARASRRRSSRASKESRPGSPSCVAQYSPGKDSPGKESSPARREKSTSTRASSKSGSKRSSTSSLTSKLDGILKRPSLKEDADVLLNGPDESEDKLMALGCSLHDYSTKKAPSRGRGKSNRDKLNNSVVW